MRKEREAKVFSKIEGLYSERRSITSGKKKRETKNDRDGLESKSQKIQKK